VAVQRIVQIASLCLFLVLLFLAAFPLVSPIAVDLFLRLDPLVFLATWLCARSIIPDLMVAALLLVFTLILGRFFCAWLCPMGITIDVADRLIGKKVNPEKQFSRALSNFKYLFLAFILGAAAGGISLVFLGSPLSLITRFYGLLVFPVLSLLASLGLNVTRPLAEAFDVPALAYAEINIPRYALQWFTVLLFTAIFACAVLSPRFWCRYLCPAGALFAVFSRRPFLRRQVNRACTRCGACQPACPMGAIPENPFQTEHSECIVCQKCVHVCPAGAISFTFSSAGTVSESVFSGQRRALIWSGLAGVGAAIVSLTSLKTIPLAQSSGYLIDPVVIRPPGALPEMEFLARCIRCGECMKACPTNTLQPLGLKAGLAGFFSPVITPRRGPCEPLCNVCTQVCPTDAIRSLTPDEKIWAKVGTAYIIKHKCLAWEYDQECLICDEVCPTNAIELKRIDNINVAVPFVEERKCSGCGFCEFQCPVQAGSAIVVEPMHAVRLASGSYRKKGREMGLLLEIQAREKQETPSAPALGPGQKFNALPPGFTE